jgi:hypothetical protein
VVDWLLSTGFLALNLRETMPRQRIIEMLSKYKQANFCIIGCSGVLGVILVLGLF